MTELIQIAIFKDDSVVSASELAGMSEQDIYDHGSYYTTKLVTREQAAKMGVDMSYIDDA